MSRLSTKQRRARGRRNAEVAYIAWRRGQLLYRLIRMAQQRGRALTGAEVHLAALTEVAIWGPL